ncbi:MAG: FtsW/RodA/SpoVE family cell cycle protein [Desertimonas sp.]
MAIPALRRRPDSGLGNIRTSPAAPGRNIDWTLLIGQGLLTTIGCFVVFSATHTRGDDPYRFVTRQVIFAIAAALATVAVMLLDYQWLRDRARVIYAATVVALFGILVLGVVSGTRPLLAIEIGPIQIQPAEFAKFTVLIGLCAYLTDDRKAEGVDYARFLGSLIMVGLPALLIIAQPDLGSGTVLIAMAMGVLLIAGAKIRYILAISFLTLITMGAAFIGNLVNDYQLERLRVFIDPNNPDFSDNVFQVRNAIRAVGTGGVFGKGWLQGPLTNSRDIPVVWADFPFAAVGEQFGLIGAATLLGLFAVVLVRIWRIAHLSRDLFGTYACAGVFTMLLWQVFQNVGMTIGIMPVTGLPMPFISYGGSSLVAYSCMFGLVQSVHMRRMR